MTPMYLRAGASVNAGGLGGFGARHASGSYMAGMHSHGSVASRRCWGQCAEQVKEDGIS